MVEKRSCRKLGIETSLLGFGCMRLPVLADGTIDRELAAKMLDKAMASGVNYYDTAYPYHEGESELFVGEYLEKWPRSSYYLATKLPSWEINTLEEAEKMFELQLRRLKKDYFDFYLLHTLNRDFWHKLRDLGVVEFCEEMQRQGKIRHFGFSFHDEYDVFEEIINYRNWDFCQIQLNYMDVNEQAGLRGLKLCKSKNIPVMIMEPVKGGSLARLPGDISKAFTDIHPDKSVSSWAMRWIGSQDGVQVILSGMSAMDQVEDNLATFTNFQPLNDEELKAIEAVSQELKKRVKNGCTGCRYCMPCPAGVNIPANFRIWNSYHTYLNRGEFIRTWTHDIDESEQAKNCVKCGKCETQCPQKISIRADLAALQAEADVITA